MLRTFLVRLAKDKLVLFRVRLVRLGEVNLRLGAIKQPWCDSFSIDPICLYPLIFNNPFFYSDDKRIFSLC